MKDSVAEELYLTMFARAEIQRAVFGALLRRLATDVPAFSLDLLSEQLHILVGHADHPNSAPNPRQKLMREVGHEELKKLIETVEAIISGQDGEGG